MGKLVDVFEEVDHGEDLATVVAVLKKHTPLLDDVLRGRIMRSAERWTDGETGHTVELSEVEAIVELHLDLLS